MTVNFGPPKEKSVFDSRTMQGIYEEKTTGKAPRVLLKALVAGLQERRLSLLSF